MQQAYLLCRCVLHLAKVFSANVVSAAVPLAEFFAPVTSYTNIKFLTKMLDIPLLLCYNFFMTTELVSPLLTEREILRLTQQELANELGVSRNFIVRAESGEYPKPPTILLEYFAGGDIDTFDLLKQKYRAYQVESRLNAFGLLDPEFEWEPYDPKFLVSRGHPFNEWVWGSPVGDEPLTLYEVSKRFCVHQAVIHRWIHEPKTVKEPPKILMAALFESGYDENVLIGLAEAYQSYRKALLT